MILAVKCHPCSLHSLPTCEQHAWKPAAFALFSAHANPRLVQLISSDPITFFDLAEDTETLDENGFTHGQMVRVRHTSLLGDCQCSCCVRIVLM
jgi:hypothetical protein